MSSRFDPRDTQIPEGAQPVKIVPPAPGSFEKNPVPPMLRPEKIDVTLEAGAEVPPRPLRSPEAIMESFVGRQESSRYEPPTGQATFKPAEHTQVKVSMNLGPKCGITAGVRPPEIAFEPPKIGQPLQRQVKIVWPKPTGQKPGAPTKMGGSCQLQPRVSGAFPGQKVPTGALSLPETVMPVVVGLSQSPKAEPDRKETYLTTQALREMVEVGSDNKTAMVAASRAVSDLVLEDPKINVSVERIVFLQRVEKLMANEARIHELESEAGVLRSTISTLGGEVARLKVELEIAKAKKGQER